VFSRISNRSTGELLVVMIAATICTLVLFTAVVVAVLEIINPGVDTSATVAILSDIVNTLIGLMAGFLAGRTEQAQAQVVEVARPIDE
jgi:hypothetical protein